MADKKKTGRRKAHSVVPVKKNLKIDPGASKAGKRGGKVLPGKPEVPAESTPAKKEGSPFLAGASEDVDTGGQALKEIFSASGTHGGPKYFFTTEIPNEYNETYMRVIPRDPEWLFLYWEISSPTLEKVKKRMGVAFESSKKILRLYFAHADQYVDREIDAFANNWYVRVPEPGMTYYAECGFLTADGRYFAAVRSNVAVAPRYGMSPDTDQDWVSATTGELIRLSTGRRLTFLGASEKRFGEEEEKENAVEMGEFFSPAAGSGSGLFGMSGDGRK
ncbi:MAG TPA: DUF4912 domain-containing protein [Chitinivibrionales bacterium]|nr:DUF4912 domain-containing protein [Chitinivibrionales bacterium]